MSNISLNYAQIVDPLSFKSINLAKIYIGEYGTLPNPANASTWKQAYFVNYDGTRTAASQPIRTNAAGFAVDGSGNIKTIQVDGGYSILVQDQLNVTKFSQACSPTNDGAVLEFDTISGFAGAPDGSTIFFKGRDTVGDSGGGMFRYSASSAATADNVTVFSPASGGRLLRDGWTANGFTGPLNPAWGGADIDGTADDTATTQLTITAADNGFLRFPAGTARINSLDVRSVSLLGNGLNTIVKAVSGALEVMQLGYVSNPSLWAYRSVSQMTIDGNSKASDGVSFADSTNTEISGRWIFELVVFRNAKKAVSKPNGNIGNVFRDVTWTNCDYGYYAVGQTSPLMHAGADEFIGGHFESCALACIYIDSPQSGTGGTILRGTIMEGNPGFALFVKNYELSYIPLLIDGVWFERNATAGSVTINGTAYTPRDVRLENTAFAVLQNGNMPPQIELVNSRVRASNVTLAEGTQYFLDSNSVISADGANIDGGEHKVIVNSLVRAKRASGNFAQRHYAPVRRLSNGVLAEKLQTLPYDGAGPFVFTGSTTVNGTSVADGRIFPTCCELVIPAGATLVQPTVNLTSGKWYVFTLDAKAMASIPAGFTLGVYSATVLVNNLQNLMVAGKWKTIASVSQAGVSGAVGFYAVNSSGSAVTLRLSAWQIMQFDTEQDALNYYNGGEYYK